MAPSRGPFSELERRNAALGVTLRARFSFRGKVSMRNSVFEFDSEILRQKKGVKVEFVRLIFRSRRICDEFAKRKCDEQKEEWRNEMEALKRSAIAGLRRVIEPVGKEIWRDFCRRLEEEVRWELQDREKSMKKREKERQRRKATFDASSKKLERMVIY